MPEGRRREQAVADDAHGRRVLEVGRVDADALLQYDVAGAEVPRRHHEPAATDRWDYCRGVPWVQKGVANWKRSPTPVQLSSGKLLQ